MKVKVIKIALKKTEDKEQSTLDETADETPRDDKEATEDDEVEIVAELPGNQAQPGHLQAERNGGQEDNQANGRVLTPEEMEKIKHPMGRNATWQTRSIQASMGNQERKEARNKKLNNAYKDIRGYTLQAAKEVAEFAKERAEALITGEVQCAWAWKQEEFFEEAEEHAEKKIAEAAVETAKVIADMTAQNNKEKEDLQKENEALQKRLEETEVRAERTVDQLKEMVEEKRRDLEAKEAEAKEATTKLEKAEEEKAEIKAELDTAKEELNDTKDELVETTRAKKEVEAQYAAKTEEMYTLEKNLTDQIGQAAEKALEDKDIQDDQDKEIKRLENDKEKEIEEKKALEEQVAELKEEVENKTKAKETLEGNLERMEERLQDEETKAKKLKDDLTTAQNDIDVSRQTVRKHQKTINDQKDAIKQMKEKKMSATLLKVMLKEKTKELEDLQKSKKELEERMTAHLIVEDEEDEQTKETEEIEEPAQDEPGYDETTDETDDDEEAEQES